jgi:hypothetical protein
MVSILGSTGNISFANSNGITFGGNASTVTASHNGITSQSVQPVAVSGSNGSFSFSTVTFGNLNGISFYSSNNSMVASHNGLTSQSNQAVSGSNGSFTFQTVTFGNLNGLSFYTSNGSLVASHNGITSQTVQPVAVSGSNGSFSFSTVTFGNLNGLSFYTSNGSVVGSYTVPAGGSPAISGSNGSFTFNTVTFGNLNGASFYTSNGSVVLSYSVPAAGGALSFSAGTSSGTFQSLVFSNSNSISFGLSGSTVTASYLDNDVTLSMWPDRVPSINFVATTNSGTTGNTGASTQITASYHIASIQVPHPVVFDRVFGFNMHSVTSAGTGSGTIGHALGLYVLDANTAMSLVSSWQFQMYVSQNSVTARTHHWFWGANSAANSTASNGNISASFTNANNAGRRIVLSEGNNTLSAGQYYLVSAYTARSAGVNVFNNGSQALLDGAGAYTAASMIGESNISRGYGFNGVFSSTTNISTLMAPIMPSTIHTSAITTSATNASGTYRLPMIIFERSKS